MDIEEIQQLDRRVLRTRNLIFNAFSELVQSCRYDELQTAMIIDRAGVGRSTFYDHFSSKDDLLKQSLKVPFTTLALACHGKCEKEHLILVLNHFWERRSLARVILQGPSQVVAESSLKEALNDAAPVISVPDNISVIMRSTGLIAILSDWVTGKLNTNSQELADWILAEMNICSE